MTSDIYGFEFWALNEKKEIKTKVAKIRTPKKTICDVTRLDRIRNLCSRENLGITDIRRRNKRE